MPTTTNFGWTTPADTDLVKDGASAMRTLGNGIDTSLVYLKGGTTGQILSKTSNTDMAFTWITPNPGDITAVNVSSPITGGGTSGDVTISIQDGTTAQKGAVQLTDSVASTSTTTAATPNSVKTSYDLANAAVPKSTVTTKGDLIAATASSTVSRLGVGNNGETLLADSATSTGLRYQPVAIGNSIINGGFDIWQRGTSFTAADVYTADRWKKDSQTYSTMTRQTTSDTTNLPTIQYCARVARNSGQTGTAALGMVYNAETADAIRYAGQAVVVSFYARAGANYSAASSNISYNFYTGTGTDQSRSFGVQFTGEANIASSTKTLTTTWQRFSFTATIGATATEWALMFYFNGVGTAGAADYFEITGVQLELGSVATSFKRSGNTLQGELAACQRYYYRMVAADAYQHFGNAWNSATTVAQAIITLPISMRVVPSSLDTGGTIAFYQHTNATDYNMSSIALVGSQQGNNMARISATISGGTLYATGWLRANNSTTAYLGFSAEL